VVRAAWIAFDKAKIAGIITGEKMKRGMGLVLAVLTFAVVAHADGIEYGGRDYAAGVAAELASQASFTEALHSSRLMMDSRSIGLRGRAISSESGDAERLTDFVYYSHFGDTDEVAERPAGPAVPAFAVVAPAGSVENGGQDYAPGANADLGPQASSAEALQSSNFWIGPGGMPFGAGEAFLGASDAARLSDLVVSSRFGDSEAAGERPIESNSTRLRIESNWGDHGEGPGEFLRIERPDPFRRELGGVQDVSEPETFLLLGAGLAALALWKRRASASGQPFVRFF
jgi:hypothetical protein